METLHTTRPLTIGDITIIPIERSVLQSDKGHLGCWLNGYKEIYTVVVCDNNGVPIQNAGPADIEIDELLQRIPDLRQMLARD